MTTIDTAELAELRKDKARLDFMSDVDCDWDGHRLFVSNSTPYYGETLRECLDQALGDDA